MDLLDSYRDEHLFAKVEELSHLDCECKQAWRARVESPETSLLPERVAQAYEIMGKELIGSDWWNKNGEDVVSELWSS